MAGFQAINYIASAIKDGSVDILGGLILANMIQLGNYKDGKMQKVTAGVSGIYNDDDDVAAKKCITAMSSYKVRHVRPFFIRRLVIRIITIPHYG